MHITILGGGFLIQQQGSPTGALALLVALKIAIDVVAHLREHRRMARQAEETEATERPQKSATVEEVGRQPGTGLPS